MYYPYAPNISDVYTLTGPDGSVAVFNDQTDPNFVGALSEVTGLDSAEVRESAEELTEADGGAHGNFFYGRRPITLTGLVYNHVNVAARTAKLDRLMRAANAMRGDAVLSWRPADTSGFYLPMMTWVRQQQPLRIGGGWNKTFQLALVSEYASLFGTTVRSSAATASGTAVVVENQGSGEAFPVIRITNASTNPSVSNNTASPIQSLHTTGLTLVTGETIEIDTLTHTAKFTAGARAGQSANRFINFGATVNWPRMARGNNSFVMSGGGLLTVLWRDTWR